jgi:putative restriction endonuclease
MAERRSPLQHGRVSRSDYWLTKFSKLRVDRARGDPAPHKPLLLLVLCDLAESGDLRDVLSLSPELAFRFYSYWRIVAGRRPQRPDVGLPFHRVVGPNGVRPAARA